MAVSKKSAVDPLAGLNALAQSAKKAPAKTTKKARVELELEPGDVALVGDLIEANEVTSIVEARRDLLKDQAHTAAFEKYTELYWKQKSQPDNPKIIVERDGIPDSDVIFMLQANFSLKQYQDAESPQDAILEALTFGGDEDLGALSEENAKELIDTEIVAESRLRMNRTLTELFQGHFEGSKYVEATEEEQALGQKLVAYLTGSPDKNGNVSAPALTDKERSALLVNEAVIKFKDPKGFLARLCSYARNVHQVRRMFNVFKPRIMFTQYHYAVNDSPAEKSKRLATAAADILGYDAK